MHFDLTEKPKKFEFETLYLLCNISEDLDTLPDKDKAVACLDYTGKLTGGDASIHHWKISTIIDEKKGML